MHPRLLDDVRYVESSQGVYLQSGRGSCVISGDHVYEWIRRLAPRLTGRAALSELTAGLPEAAGSMIETLIDTLHGQQFVVDARDDRPHTLPASELAEYAPEISFIRYAYDSPEWRFEQLRASRVLVLGSGPVLPAVITAGLHSGWRNTRVLADPGDPIHSWQVEPGRRDGAQRVRIEPRTGAAPSREVLREADLVVQIEPGDGMTALLDVERSCVEQGVALVQVLVRESEAWLTPLRAADHGSGQWGWRWLSPTARGEAANWLTGPVPLVVASQLTLACFRYLARMSPERQGRPIGVTDGGSMTRIDLRSLDTSSHRFPPGRATVSRTVLDNSLSTAELAGEAIRCLRATPPTTMSALVEQARAVTDPFLGLVRSVDEQDLPQFPLALARCEVRDPDGAVTTALGWGDAQDVARARSLLAALAQQRSLEFDRLTGPGPGPGEQVWGLDLLTGRLRAVPAAVLGSLNDPPAGPPGVTTSAGLSWDDAVENGLLGHCEALLTPGVGAAVTEFDPVAAATGAGTLHLLALLRSTGEPVVFHDHTAAALGIPTCTVTCVDELVARSSAATFASAVRNATERALLHGQLRSGSGPASVRLPAARPWSGIDDPDAGHPVTIEGLAGAVKRGAGCSPVAIPLAGNDVTGSLLPFVVRIVLCAD